jgi:2,3,4,5-tetrahydropyridine-2-carboxylate N-succinyltransferase
MSTLQATIEAAFERRAEITPSNVDAALLRAIEDTIELLDSGRARVAEKKDGQWVVNEWLKKAVLLHFRTHDNKVIDSGYTRFYDKVPLKYQNATEEQLRAGGARVVPSAIARRGAYVAPNTVLMPSYVKNVHLSGGVGIGGVLEPLQAAPTIIEDDCFIGARSEVVEGVIVEQGAVLSMGVFIGQGTRIYDRATGKVYRGRVPSGAVVVPGTLPSEDGKYGLYCAIIVKQVDAQTRKKTSINELLRGVE